jgi:hypothetical protein
VRSEDYQYLLPVSAAQVYQLMQSLDGSEQPGSGALRVLLALAGAWNGLTLADIEADTRLQGKRVHRSLVQGVLVLSAFAEGKEFGPALLGERLGMEKSMIWRYAQPWTAIGVLEQTAENHRYRLARRLL